MGGVKGVPVHKRHHLLHDNGCADSSEVTVVNAFEGFGGAGDGAERQVHCLQAHRGKHYQFGLHFCLG